MSMKLVKKIVCGLTFPAIFCFASCSKMPKVHTFISKKADDGFGNLTFALNVKDFAKEGYNFNDLVTLEIPNIDGNGNNATYEVAIVTNYNEVGYYVPCICNYENKSDHYDFSFGIDTKNREIAKNTIVGKEAIFDIKKTQGYKKVRDLVRVDKKLSYEETGFDNNVFANFRDVSTEVGKISESIKTNILFRGSTPFNKKANPDRYEVADRLMGANYIDYEISLGNTNEEITREMNNLPSDSYSRKLWDTKTTQSKSQFLSVPLAGDYFSRGISHSGQSEKLDGDAMQEVFKYIAEKCVQPIRVGVAPSFYIHCNEGKDRTGFVIMVLEALAGVSLEDIVSDFMLTFKNYYNISYVNNKEKYNKLADLTIYHLVYSLLLCDQNCCKAKVTDKLAKINWNNFDAKQEVENLIKQKIDNGDKTPLLTSAQNYLEYTLEINSTDIRNIQYWLHNS